MTVCSSGSHGGDSGERNTCPFSQATVYRVLTLRSGSTLRRKLEGVSP
jgi:hypothetical protein